MCVGRFGLRFNWRMALCLYLYILQSSSVYECLRVCVCRGVEGWGGGVPGITLTFLQASISNFTCNLIPTPGRFHMLSDPRFLS